MKKSTYIPVLITLGALAIAYRVPKAKQLLTGDDGSWF